MHGRDVHAIFINTRMVDFSGIYDGDRIGVPGNTDLFTRERTFIS